MSRYELTGIEWRVIEPLLPGKVRDVPRVDDRRVLNGIFWVLAVGCAVARFTRALWAAHPCYNCFTRWRKAGVWDQLMDAITAAYDGATQSVDRASVRAHQQATIAKRALDHCLGRSRGGTRNLIDAQGAVSNIPPTANRR